MKKVAVLLAFALASIGVAVVAAPAGAAFTGYSLGDLSLQNGWNRGLGGGAFDSNLADSNVITDTDTLTGTQSWRFSGGSNSIVDGSPFSPQVATVGALNAVDAGSPITPDGNESVVTFAFKAVVPGDGSSINLYEGGYSRDSRTGASLYLQNDTANGNPADTVSLFNFSANDDSPDCTTAQVILGSVSVGAWHTVEMTSTYGNVAVGDPSTFGSTTYVFDKGTVDEQTATMQSAPHAQRDCLGTPYVPGGSLKFANSFNDYPTHQGFYIDDLSMTVRNTVGDTIEGQLSTSFEPLCSTVCFVAAGGSGDESGIDAANALPTIQAGIDAVVAGGTVNVAAGTYAENVTIAKALDLVGAGADDTVLDPSSDGPAISISAGGSSLTDRLKIRLLKTTGATTSGNSASGIAFVGSDPINHVTIDSVESVANATHGLAFLNSGAMTDLVFNNDTFSNNGTDPTGDGIYISGDPTIDGLTITNSQLNNNALGGLEIYVDPAATNLSNTHVQNVLVEDTTFDGNASKGIYAERLKDAVLRRVNVENTATTENAAFPSPAGIELDLRYQDYSGITIEDSDILTNGNTGTPQGTNSSGIAIKARGSGSDGAPFDANPATLTDVTITDSRITANAGDGVRIGEPGANNTGPTDVHVTQSSITANTIGPSPFGLENVTTSTVDGVCNWWGAADGPSGAGPGTGDAVSSDVTFTPFKTISATDTCPPTVPGAPIDAVATAGDQGLSVSFTVPDNGGFAITGYTATCSSTVSPYPSNTATSATGPVFVGSLDVGVVHVCWVFATNALGDSANSNFALGTPADLPDAPTNVVAFAGDESSTVSWTAPAIDGGSPITGYTVTSSPDGETCSWTTGPLTCTVNSLTNGTDYTFTVRAENAPGLSVPSAVSNEVTPLDWAGHFHPVVPARILDTRTATGGHPAKATAGETFNLQVTGQGGVPASGVTAVVMNVAVTQPTAPSFLTLWPEGDPKPAPSNLNFVTNQTRPNLVTVKVGPTGMVSIFNGSGSTHIVADVSGWYSDDTVVGGSRFQALVPDRILDTRTGNGHTGPAGAAQSFDLQVTGRGGVPASGVTAVVMNVGVTGPTASSFLTIWPQGTAQPTASNLNFVANQTVPNLVVVKVGPTGMVTIFNGAGSTHVIADVFGWYSDTSVAGGGRFAPVVPARILDTRTANGGHPTVVTAGETFNLQVTGRGNVPASGVTAVVLNVTVTNPTALSFLTLWPESEAQPPTANLNFLANQTVPNLVVVKVGPDGKVSIFNGAGTTNVIGDVFGWFKAPSEP